MKNTCFLGTTSYGIQFDRAEGVMKQPTTKPITMDPIKSKFRGKSEYAGIFSSNLHKEQAGGSILQDETKEMKMRSRQLVNHNRKGYLAGEQKPFVGNSSQADAQKAVLNNDLKFNQNTAQFKPLDSLLCSNKIKSVAKTSTKQQHFDAKQAKYCAYQKQLKDKSNNFIKK